MIATRLGTLCHHHRGQWRQGRGQGRRCGWHQKLCPTSWSRRPPSRAALHPAPQVRPQGPALGGRALRCFRPPPAPAASRHRTGCTRGEASRRSPVTRCQSRRRRRLRPRGPVRPRRRKRTGGGAPVAAACQRARSRWRTHRRSPESGGGTPGSRPASLAQAGIGKHMPRTIGRMSRTPPCRGVVRSCGTNHIE